MERHGGLFDGLRVEPVGHGGGGMRPLVLEAPGYHLEVLGDDYGWFESISDGDADGGGLWFKHGVLVDYDGVVELPAPVVSALRRAGFTVGADFGVVAEQRGAP